MDSRVRAQRCTAWHSALGTPVYLEPEQSCMPIEVGLHAQHGTAYATVCPQQRQVTAEQTAAKQQVTA
jgi:hypothetical protein